MLQGTVVYGSWKNGSDIYKDSKGYYIIEYVPTTNSERKKYLKRWKPAPNAPLLCLNAEKKKWKLCKTKKQKKSSKTKTRKH